MSGNVDRGESDTTLAYATLKTLSALQSFSPIWRSVLNSWLWLLYTACLHLLSKVHKQTHCFHSRSTELISSCLLLQRCPTYICKHLIPSATGSFQFLGPKWPISMETQGNLNIGIVSETQSTGVIQCWCNQLSSNLDGMGTLFWDGTHLLAYLNHGHPVPIVLLLTPSASSVYRNLISSPPMQLFAWSCFE